MTQTTLNGKADPHLRMGYTPDLGVFPVDDEVGTVINEAVDALADAGATVDSVTVDHGLSLDERVSALTTTRSIRGLMA